MYYEAVQIVQNYIPFAVPVVLTAFLVVFLDKILGHVFGKSKKFAARMAKSVMEHESFKPFMDTQGVHRKFFLVILEERAAELYYELTGKFHAAKYRDRYLKISEAYQEMGGNGLIKTWDKILKDLYEREVLLEEMQRRQGGR